MKKPLVLLIAFVVMSISALFISTYKAPSEDFLKLEDQFNSYLGRDFTTTSNFIEYINHLQYNNETSFVKLEVISQNQSMTLSGVIIHKINDFAYFVTSDDFMGLSGPRQLIINDYKGQIFHGEIVKSDATLGLVYIGFQSDYYEEYQLPTNVTNYPLNGEIVSMISVYNDINNYVSLGIFGQLNENLTYSIDILESIDCIGGAIYDINSNFIGIITKRNGILEVVTYQTIAEFISYIEY